MSPTRFKTINATKSNPKRIKSGNKFSKNKSKILPQKITIIKPKNDNKIKFNLKRGINKKDYSINLLRRCQMKYNSFIKKHQDVTMYGTKRYENKSGSYYLQNLSKEHMNQKSITSLKLKNKNYTYKNHDHISFNSNFDIIKSTKKKVHKELNQITIEKKKNKIKEEYEKKNAFNTIGNTKYLRRYQYSNKITQKQIKQNKEMRKKDKIFLDKTKFIQIWWKTIFQVIKIQKYIRGYIYRIKLISSLEEKEDYIDKVLYMVKIIKKILLYRLYNKLSNYKSGKKYYFYKWNEFSSKKLILNKIKTIYLSMKSEENYFFTARNIADNNLDKENDKNDFENGYYKIGKKTNREDDINKNLIGTYTNSIKNQKIKKRQKKSTSSYTLKTKKKDINIGIKISSSQILKRTKNINDISHSDCKNKRKIFINNNIINEYGNVKKRENKRNNNQPKFNKFINTHNKNLLKKKTLIKKFSKDLKSLKYNYNNLINDSKKNINLNKNNTFLIKSSNKTLVQSLHANTKREEDSSNKNTNNKNKVHNYSISNVTNHSENLINNRKNKTLKIYENELTNYNKNINSRKKNIYENQFLSIDKEELEKMFPYTERIFDESQFNDLLGNSFLNNNKNAYNNNDDNQVTYYPKNMTINTYIDVESIVLHKNLRYNNNEIDKNVVKLKTYFSIWVRKTIIGLLLNHGTKRIYSGRNILIKLFLEKYWKIFISNFKQIYNLLLLKKFFVFFERHKMKVVFEKIKMIGNKYLLLKYFNHYRSFADKSRIINNIIQYGKIQGLKNKNNKINKESLLLCSNCDIGNEYHHTDFPNNNIFNINNNSNNCFIINNLNYNNYNNEISIELNNETDLNNNNTIPNKNNKRSFGVIRSKIIEFPTKSYINYEAKTPISNHEYWNNNIANQNTIDNSNLFRSNKERNIKNIKSDNIDINKIPINNQGSLCESITISNNIYLKPDLITQTNQLMMVINIIENHRKFQTKNLFLAHFKRWRNQNINIQNSNINLADENKQNIKLKNIKTAKNQNMFCDSKNDNIFNSYGTIDNKEIVKNTIDSEELRTEPISENENKILNKSRLIQNNKFNLEINDYYTSSTFNFQENKYTNDIVINKSLKGVYKKKTIGGHINKSMNFFKKNNFNHSLNQSNNLLQSTNASPADIIFTNTNIKESEIEENKNVFTIQNMSDKTLDIILPNNNTVMSGINFRYSSPEKYFGFKKVNKIEEMEVSFLPLNEKKINISNTNESEDKDIDDRSISINKDINNESNDELCNIDKKEVIVENIEEDKEYENIIQRLKKEFDNNEKKLFYKTYNNFNKNYYEGINKDQEKNI